MLKHTLFTLAFILCNVSLAIAKEGRTTFMSWNVENLFDTQHDADKDDWEFLPKNFPGKSEACEKVENPGYKKKCFDTDWTDEKLNLKLKQIQKMVMSVGELPDILALQEVENKNVVTQLAQLLGYNQVILEEGPDTRGIDVALLIKENAQLKYVRHLTVEVKAEHKTRPLLAVQTQIMGQDTVIVVQHWPSQGNPVASRLAAAEALKNVVTTVQQKSKGLVPVIAVGDFNTISEDRPDPFYSVITNPSFKYQMTDLDTLVRAKLNPRDLPLGTYFFGTKMQWNLLDHAFLTSHLLDGKGLDVDIQSYKIVNTFTGQWYYNANHPHGGTVVKGIPQRYDHNSTDEAKAGFSDHFPLYFELVNNP